MKWKHFSRKLKCDYPDIFEYINNNDSGSAYLFQNIMLERYYIYDRHYNEPGVFSELLKRYAYELITIEPDYIRFRLFL